MITRTTKNGQTTVMDDTSGVRRYHVEDATPDVSGTQEEKMGWGDKVEKRLQALGITPENYVAVKEKFGLPPTCNCKGRKEWLNKVGEWFNAKKA